LLPPILAIWAVLAGAGLVRSDEQRGALDLVLAMPHARARVLAEKVAGFVAASLLIAILIGFGTLIGELLGQLAVGIGDALLVGLNVSLTALFYGLLALVFAQLLTQQAAAAACAGALLAAGYLLDATGRTIEGAAWLGRLSPFYYHNLSKPLIAGYGVNAVALAGLATANVALAALALALFLRRDIGGTALPALRWLPPARLDSGVRALAEAGPSPSVRNVGLRAWRAELPPLLWWAVGIGATTAWITMLARTLGRAFREVLAASPSLTILFGEFDFGTDTGYLGGMIFFYLPVLVVLQALTAALAWSGDLEAGRLELVLATAQPRRRVILERFAVVVTGTLVVTAASWAAMMATVWFAGLEVDAGRLIVAYLGMVPLALLTAAMVYALAGWLRVGAVLAICSTLIVISYAMDVLSALLDLPSWVLDLSIFHQYGHPMTEDPRWGAWLALTALAAGLLALGVARFERADV
jgi:ABC-2 type transport system permease protein